MVRFVLGRVLQLLGVMFAVLAIVFFALRLGPFDPADIVSDTVIGDPERLAELRAHWGLDEPVWTQFSKYFLGVLQGDFGRSLQTNEPVTLAIQQRLPATIELALAAMLVGVLLGTGLGIIAAYKRDSSVDFGSRMIALAGISFPSFWLGVVAIAIFAAKFQWLPAGGRLSSRTEFDTITGLYTIDGILRMRFDVVEDAARHLLLPALVLGVSVAGLITRITRAALLEELGRDYVRTALAKGNSPIAAAARHALPNALLPIITIVGLSLGLLLSGAVIVEAVFAYPGMGKLLVDSISVRDFPQIQASILVLAAIYVLVNTCVDVLYAVIDPRVRLG